MSRRRQSLSIAEENLFQMVIDELLEQVMWHPAHSNVDEAHDWLAKVVEYNVPHGKQIR